MGHYRGGRSVIEETPRVTIADLTAWGFIPRPGKNWEHTDPWERPGTLTLSENGTNIGSVGATVRLDGAWGFIRFDYLLGYEKKPVTYEHGLESVPLHYGGRRYYFRCRHCRRRVTALYLAGGYYACRHCQRLAYETSQEHRTLGEHSNRAWSMRNRAERLRKYGHPRKANRLYRRADVLDALGWLDVARWVGMKAGQ